MEFNVKFMGSKNRHAKEILPFIIPYLDNKIYIEPFCGGCNMLDKIPSVYRVGVDIDADLICLWQAVSKGWLPPKHFTEQEYYEIRNSKELSPLKGYAAFALSYAGKKWGGWCRDKLGKRNYVDEAYRNSLKQFPKLADAVFFNSNYLDLFISRNFVVYCDPPYENTTGYKNKNFNHLEYWEWVRYISKKNIVFCSEYQAPEDFICIWEKTVNSGLKKNGDQKKSVEKLFVHDSIVDKNFKLRYNLT